MNSLCTYVIVSLGHLIIQKVKFAQEILDLERLGGKCLKDKYYHMSCTLSNYTLIYWTRVKNMFCDSESGDDSGFDTRCIRVFIMYQEEHGHVRHIPGNQVVQLDQEHHRYQSHPTEKTKPQY